MIGEAALLRAADIANACAAAIAAPRSSSSTKLARDEIREPLRIPNHA
jgi:hypothetical protein